MGKGLFVGNFPYMVHLVSSILEDIDGLLIQILLIDFS